MAQNEGNVDKLIEEYLPMLLQDQGARLIIAGIVGLWVIKRLDGVFGIEGDERIKKEIDADMLALFRLMDDKIKNLESEIEQYKKQMSEDDNE